MRGLRLYFTCCLALGFNTVLAAYFTSVERAKPAHLLSLLRGLVLIIPAAVSMAALWGMDGVWLSCTVTEMAAALLGIVVFLRTSEE